MKKKLGDIPDTNFETKPVGWYHVVIREAKVKVSDNTDNPYASLQMAILEGEYKKQRIFKNFTLIEKCLTFIKPFLMAIGYTKNDSVEIDSAGLLCLDPEEWLGKQLMVHLKHRVYEGEKKEEVDAYKGVEEEIEDTMVYEQRKSSAEDVSDDGEEIPF